MPIAKLPDMRFASTIRNAFQNTYSSIMKRKLAQEGKVGTQEIKSFELEESKYLRFQVICTVILKNVIIMPFLQSIIYAELFIVCKPWLSLVVRSGLNAGSSAKNWMDKFILLRAPKPSAL